MKIRNRSLAASARDYVLALDLPDRRKQFRALAARPAFSDKPEAVTVGAQLTEFAEGVPPDVRSTVADSMLLAQLAANKAASQSANVFGWYEKYTEVLLNIGWRTQDFEFRTQQVSDTHLGVHKAIIPVLTAMLGPAVAAISIVVSVLEGLEEMDKTMPWIALFDKASQHAHGAKFQIGYVADDAAGDPEITLACFVIDADRTITQVLFFKYSAENAEVKQATGKLTANAKRLNSAKDAVAERVSPFIRDYVRQLDI